VNTQLAPEQASSGEPFTTQVRGAFPRDDLLSLEAKAALFPCYRRGDVCHKLNSFDYAGQDELAFTRSGGQNNGRVGSGVTFFEGDRIRLIKAYPKLERVTRRVLA
jgi:hypothetical protein